MADVYCYGCDASLAIGRYYVNGVEAWLCARCMREQDERDGEEADY